jgi:hypothetical protein
MLEGPYIFMQFVGESSIIWGRFIKQLTMGIIYKRTVFYYNHLGK